MFDAKEVGEKMGEMFSVCRQLNFVTFMEKNQNTCRVNYANYLI